MARRLMGIGGIELFHLESSRREPGSDHYGFEPRMGTHVSCHTLPMSLDLRCSTEQSRGEWTDY